jgi:hypothetical protein
MTQLLNPLMVAGSSRQHEAVKAINIELGGKSYALPPLILSQSPPFRGACTASSACTIGIDRDYVKPVLG